MSHKTLGVLVVPSFNLRGGEEGEGEGGVLFEEAMRASMQMAVLCFLSSLAIIMGGGEGGVPFEEAMRASMKMSVLCFLCFLAIIIERGAGFPFKEAMRGLIKI